MDARAVSPTDESHHGDALEEVLERNKRFVVDAHRELPLLPRLNMCVVACPDARVDPAHVLGLEPGEAAVVRAAAGRISPIVLQQLLFLAQAGTAGGQRQDGLELVLMQHTDCGITQFLEGERRAALAAWLGCTLEELNARSPGDPYGGVRADIEVLAANELIPAALSVTGLVYDVHTGRAELVERRSPLRASATPSS